MAKGIVIGILVVLVVLPSLILVFDKPIHRWSHRSLIPDLTRLNDWIIDHKKTFVAIFLVLFVPALIMQSRTQIYYNIDQSLPEEPCRRPWRPTSSRTSSTWRPHTS